MAIKTRVVGYEVRRGGRVSRLIKSHAAASRLASLTGGRVYIVRELVSLGE